MSMTINESALKDINFGFNSYCGPSVLSALTGKSTDECAGVISSISGKKVIKAVEVNHLIKALEKLRFDVVKEKVFGYSLYSIISKLSERDGCYIVLVPRHVVAIEIKDKKVYFIDNHTKTPIDAAASARLTQRVDDVYKVTAREVPQVTESKVVIRSVLNTYYIEKIFKYKDERDNITINLGYFRYSSSVELGEIITELGKVI